MDDEIDDGGDEPEVAYKALLVALNSHRLLNKTYDQNILKFVNSKRVWRCEKLQSKWFDYAVEKHGITIYSSDYEIEIIGERIAKQINERPGLVIACLYSEKRKRRHQYSYKCKRKPIK